MKTIAAIALTFAAFGSAQQVMKDKKQLCQITAPTGWTADKIMPGSITSPDRKSSAVFSSKPDANYADTAKMAKEMFKPTQIFEETPKKTSFASAKSVYVVLNTSPVCEAQVEFKDPSFAPTAKQMIDSLKSTK